MTIEIVDFPIKNGEFPVRYVNVYQRVGPSGICMMQASGFRKNGGKPAIFWACVSGICMQYVCDIL